MPPKFFYKFVFWYVLVLVIFCFAIGLTHMYSRAITLDSARNIDFSLVKSAISMRGDGRKVDTDHFLNVSRNLATDSGYAFYPLAVVGPDSCVENNGWPNICRNFESTSMLLEKIQGGTVAHEYGVKIIKTKDEDVFYLDKVPGTDEWLVGEAGKYLFAGHELFGRERVFFSNLPELSFNKMVDKSYRAWIICFIIAFVVFVLHFTSKLRAERDHKVLQDKNKKLENKLADSTAGLTRLSHEKLKLKAKLVNVEEQTEEETRMLWEELESKDDEILKAAEDQDRLAKERDALAIKIKENWSSRDSKAQKLEAEKAFQTLHDIKKLWLTDPDWQERHDIEKSLAAESLERAPFTEFVAFVRMEWYLKTMCELKRIYDVQDNAERINSLRDGGFLSKTNANLLHEVRRARNLWFHEGVSPDRSLVERFLKFLEKQKNPSIKPEI